MSQETRKDKRANVFSLNVRYKSATVDEFIENHSHDVSKGGVFVKTNNPFAAGTLLKLEIRLAGDTTVIAGVGRVVWKRDLAQATAHRPAGMGVKFIKIDDSSREFIDRLISEKSDAGAAFLSGGEGETVTISRPPPRTSAIPAGHPTPRGVAPPGIAPSAAPRPSSPISSKQIPSQRPAAGTPAEGSRSMFPGEDTSAPTGESVREKTVMKQTAELLEEALREAGGSMDEVGSNPLFDKKPGASEEPPRPATPFDDEPKTVRRNSISVVDELRSEEREPARAESSQSVRAESSPSARAETSPSARAETSRRDEVDDRETEEREAETGPGRARPAVAQPPAPSRKSQVAWMWPTILVLLGIGAYAAYRATATSGQDVPPPLPTPAPSQALPEPTLAMDAEIMPLPTIQTVDAAAAAVVTDAARVDVAPQPKEATSALAPAPPAPPAPPALVAPKPVAPKPAPKPEPRPEPETPADKPAPAGKPEDKPAPVEKPSSEASESAPSETPAPKPKPKPKPKAQDDDNPY